MKKKLNLNISLVRVILCIAVLLYHLEFLKGGFLAVCSFFVLAGYFSCISMFKSEKHTIINHYIKRIKGVIIPLLVVVFTTLTVMSLLNIVIYNFKPEVTSVLINNNNYFQINANVDYFAKRVESPFIHLWYISILVQLELILPFIFIIFKYIGKKAHKLIPCILTCILSIVSILYFCNIANTKSIMFTYYDTIARSFSFICGISLAFIHNYYNKLTPKLFTKKIISIIFFTIYLLSLIGLFIFIDSSNKYYYIYMIISTIITLRLIEYGNIMYKNNTSIKSKLINYLSNISYEIYLVQYPVIYIVDSLKISNNIKIYIIILSIIIVSMIIHKALNILNRNKIKILEIIILIPVLISTIYGIYQYIEMKDYTKEIEDLKNELDNNEKLMKEKQEEYKKKQQDKEDEWNKYLESLEVDENQLRKYVTNLRIVGIGDSIMLDAVNHLYKAFPNAYFDAKISRNTCAAGDVFQGIKDQGIEWDVLVFSLGTNGSTSAKCKDRLLQIAGDKKIFWLNTTNPDYKDANEAIYSYAKKHSNVYVLDWETLIKSHPEYLYSDYIHLRPQGMTPYAEFIKNEMVKIYKAEYDKEKEKLISKHNEEVNNNVTFYGGEILLNAFNLLQEKYPNAKYEVSSDINYNKIKESIENDIKNDKLNKKLVFILNKELSEDEYNKIIKLCDKHEIYILSFNNIDINNDNVKVINYSLDKNKLMDDGVHLKEETNKELIKSIEKEIN